jgi:multidrug efflux pump subunit AcrA (membrane-fusion protein)
LTLAYAKGADWSRSKLELEIAQANEALSEQALKLASADVSTYLEQAVKRSQLAVDRLNGLIAERQIIAPYDGVVLKSTIRSGVQHDAFNVAFSVGDPTTMVVQAQYDTTLASKMNANSDVSIYLNPDDQAGYAVKYLVDYQAVHGDKSAQASSGQDFLYFSLPKDVPANQLTVGKNVKMAVILGKKDSTLLLVPAAIREYKGLHFVILMDGDRRRRVEISEIGLQSKDKWEIVADLKEGDKVLGP